MLAVVADRLVIVGPIATVNETPLLACPLTVTTTLPVLAPLGTVATMDVALQLVAVALVPLNVTVLVPCVEPKFVPVIVTDVPTAPEVGDSPLMFGLGNTAKLTPLLFTPLAWTTTAPVVAPDGTEATIDVELQLVTVANVPLKVTVLVPCVEPKFEPLIVRPAPTGPCVRLSVEMLGPAAVTVNSTPLLGVPATLTTTFPVVAPLGTGTTMLVAVQLVGAPAIVLKVTLLDP